ncbi:helix-turn-helix domain-containing protein [Klebsiella pneumoniae]
MDRFSALKAFTRVVEAGSFTRAADSLNMPTPPSAKPFSNWRRILGFPSCSALRGVSP